MTTTFDNEYTQAQALTVVLRRLREFDPILADEAQAAIDRGRDEISRDAIGPKVHLVRRTVPFTVDESLGLVVGLLRAHLVEQPLITNAALREIRATPIGNDESRARHEISLAAAVHVETVSPASSAIRADAREQVVQPLEAVPEPAIDEVARLVNDLANLFSTTSDGDPR